MKVTAGEWANFSCTINCSNTSLRWRLVSPMIEVMTTRFFPAGRLEKVWRKKGITIRSVTGQSGSRDYESATIQIQSTSQMDGAVIQCGAISSRRSVSSLYSKFGVLLVEPAPEPETQDSVEEEEPATEESIGSEDTTRTIAPPTTPPPSH